MKRNNLLLPRSSQHQLIKPNQLNTSQQSSQQNENENILNRQYGQGFNNHYSSQFSQNDVNQFSQLQSQSQSYHNNNNNGRPSQQLPPPQQQQQSSSILNRSFQQNNNRGANSLLQTSQKQHLIAPSTPINESYQPNSVNQLLSQQQQSTKPVVSTPRTPLRTHGSSQQYQQSSKQQQQQNNTASQLDMYDNAASQLFDTLLADTLQTITHSQSQSQQPQQHQPTKTSSQHHRHNINNDETQSSQLYTQPNNHNNNTHTPINNQQPPNLKRQEERSQMMGLSSQQSTMDNENQLLSQHNRPQLPQILAASNDSYDPNSLLSPVPQQMVQNERNVTLGKLKNPNQPIKQHNRDRKNQQDSDFTTTDIDEAVVNQKPIINRVQKPPSNQQKLSPLPQPTSQQQQQQQQFDHSPATPSPQHASLHHEQQPRKHSTPITTISNETTDDEYSDDDFEQNEKLMKNRHLFVSPIPKFGSTPVLATPTPFGHHITPLSTIGNVHNRRVGALVKPNKIRNINNDDYLSESDSDIDLQRWNDRAESDTDAGDESDNDLSHITALNTHRNKIETTGGNNLAAVARKSAFDLIGVTRSHGGLRSTNVKKSEPLKTVSSKNKKSSGVKSTSSVQPKSSKKTKSSTRSTNIIHEELKSFDDNTHHDENNDNVKKEDMSSDSVKHNKRLKTKTKSTVVNKFHDTTDDEVDDELDDGIPIRRRTAPTAKKPAKKATKKQTQQKNTDQRLFDPNISTHNKPITRNMNNISDDEKDDELARLYVRPTTTIESRPTRTLRNNNNENIVVKTTAPYLTANDLAQIQGGKLYTDNEIDFLAANFDLIEIQNLAHFLQTDVNQLQQQIDSGEVSLEDLRKQTSEMTVSDKLSKKRHPVTEIVVKQKAKSTMNDTNDEGGTSNNNVESQKNNGDESEDEIIIHKKSNKTETNLEGEITTLRELQHEAAKNDERLAYKLAFGHSPLQSAMNGLYLPHEEGDWQMKYFQDIDAQTLFAESGFHLYSEDDSSESDSDWDGFGPSNQRGRRGSLRLRGNKAGKNAVGNYTKESRRYKAPNIEYAVLKARHFEERSAASFTANLAHATVDYQLEKTAMDRLALVRRVQQRENEEIRSTRPEVFNALQYSESSDEEINLDEDGTDTKPARNKARGRPPKDPNAPKRERKPKDPNAPKRQRKPKDPNAPLTKPAKDANAVANILGTKKKQIGNVSLLAKSMNNSSNGLDSSLLQSISNKRNAQQGPSLLGPNPNSGDKPPTLSTQTQLANRSKKINLDSNSLLSTTAKPKSQQPAKIQLDENGVPIQKPPRAKKGPQLDENGNPIQKAPRAKKPQEPKLDENGNLIPPKPRGGKKKQSDIATTSTTDTTDTTDNINLSSNSINIHSIDTASSLNIAQKRKQMEPIGEVLQHDHIQQPPPKRQEFSNYQNQFMNQEVQLSSQGANNLSSQVLHSQPNTSAVLLSQQPTMLNNEQVFEEVVDEMGEDIVYEYVEEEVEYFEGEDGTEIIYHDEDGNPCDAEGNPL